MASSESEFPTELRGYKRAEVDEAISTLRADLIQAAKERTSALEEVTQLKNQLAALGTTAADVTYASLGSRLESILRIAEEQSTALIGQADISAEKALSLAKLEAQTLVETATREAERLTLNASNEAATVLDGATADATRLVTQAQEEAERQRKDAIDEASSIRGAVATEASKVRATAQREAEALRAHAQQTVAEAAVVAEQEINAAKSERAELNKDLAAERASHEMTLKAIAQEAELAKTTMEKELAETTARLTLENEQQAEALARAAAKAHASLETELAARRAEAEKELLEAHQKAVDLNDRYTADLAEQHKDLKERVAALRDEHQKLIEAIQDSNATAKTRALKEASDLVAAAEKKAAGIIQVAEEEATSRVAAAEARLIELSAERETIASYVESLRTVVDDALDQKPPRPAKARKTRAKDTSQG